MSEIYLKIYTENDDTIVFEGQYAEDKPGYFPTRWDDTTKRLGTVVVGCEHISITEKAKEAFKRIVNAANHTGDDLSCLHIWSSRQSKDTCEEVVVGYLGDIITRWNIEEVIADEDFFIGTGECAPDLRLLDQLVQDSESDR